MIEVKIEYNPKTGAVRMSHPNDPVMTLGIIERAKALYVSKLDRAKPDSGIVGAKAMPTAPNGGRA